MNTSPFKRGDFVKVKRDYFQKESFDSASSPLKLDEVGIVTSVSTQSDSRPRYIQVNGEPPLYHFSMFEAATPHVMARLRLRLVRAFSWR